jgi:hypothetical protein
MVAQEMAVQEIFLLLSIAFRSAPPIYFSLGA